MSWNRKTSNFVDLLVYDLFTIFPRKEVILIDCLIENDSIIEKWEVKSVIDDLFDRYFEVSTNDLSDDELHNSFVEIIAEMQHDLEEKIGLSSISTGQVKQITKMIISKMVDKIPDTEDSKNFKNHFLEMKAR